MNRSRRLVVDRREGDFVVVELESGETVDVPARLLPPGVKEGDVLRLEVAVDAEATRRARDDAAARLARLRERDPGGDVEL